MRLFQRFSTDGNLGTLRPALRLSTLRLPAWLALLPGLPMLTFALLLLVIPISQRQLVIQAFLAISGSTCVLFWMAARKVSRQAGMIRIDRDRGLIFLTGRNGSETRIPVGRFLSMRVEQVRIANRISWRAVLCGAETSVALDSGATRRSTRRHVSPVADWLNIPVEFPDYRIAGLTWVYAPDPGIDPYHGQDLSPEQLPPSHLKQQAAPDETGFCLPDRLRYRISLLGMGSMVTGLAMILFFVMGLFGTSFMTASIITAVTAYPIFRMCFPKPSYTFVYLSSSGLRARPLQTVEWINIGWAQPVTLLETRDTPPGKLLLRSSDKPAVVIPKAILQHQNFKNALQACAPEGHVLRRYCGC